MQIEFQNPLNFVSGETPRVYATYAVSGYFVRIIFMKNRGVKAKMLKQD
jgi:hypothetical protein